MNYRVERPNTEQDSTFFEVKFPHLTTLLNFIQNTEEISMTYIITSLCLRDSGCVDVCPVECIVPGKP